MKYIKAGTHIKEEEHLKAWLIRVTINCCNSVQTSWWRKKVVPAEVPGNMAETADGEENSRITEALRSLPGAKAASRHFNERK